MNRKKKEREKLKEKDFLCLLQLSLWVVFPFEADSNGTFCFSMLVSV